VTAVDDLVHWKAKHRRRALDAFWEHVPEAAPGLDLFRPLTPYVVIHGTGTDRDGMWYERQTDVYAVPPSRAVPGLTLEATGKYERREDGMLGEVYAPREA